jgi:hypothetical protein
MNQTLSTQHRSDPDGVAEHTCAATWEDLQNLSRWLKDALYTDLDP